MYIECDKYAVVIHVIKINIVRVYIGLYISNKWTRQVLTKKHVQAQRRPFKSVDLFGPNHHGAVSVAREHDTMTSSQPR